jgi:UDP-N-acetylmuramoyl-L-alanyl-D-glutamate--2,6-diaminopimelate ligase
MEKVLRLATKLIPRKIFTFFQPIYHWKMALLGAIIYRFPSKKIKVVAITGTKGKTSTVEFVNAILEAAGFKTALAGTLRFKIGDDSRPNLYKMTMPGRFFIQKFLRRAVDAGCEYAVIEISSEASKQYRHKFIDLDALIFTNIAPEHIESHGSFEKYLQAKLNIAKALERSPKKNKIIVSNMDDAEGETFLNTKVTHQIPYSLKDAGDFALTDSGSNFYWKGRMVNSKVLGKFNIYNMLGAASLTSTLGIDDETIKQGLETVTEIQGRAQKIDCGQKFEVIVDYAHTPDSLRAIYETFTHNKIIGVLGNCGGGRDKWKRQMMAEIADHFCTDIILTDEDPYDDDPMEIILDMAKFIKKETPTIEIDRRRAIAAAFETAKNYNNPNVVVVITGKGTDPYIMRKDGKKESWSDAEVAREELKKLLAQS